jgi:pimeloyl-ACP methyl ester carboxylesterase
MPPSVGLVTAEAAVRAVLRPLQPASPLRPAQGCVETWAGLCDDAQTLRLVRRPGRGEMTKTMLVAGVNLELVERGDGRPLLFLHAGEGLAPERPWLDLLSRKYRVIAPWHPGWGNSALIDGMGLVDDLAYLYLELAAELGLEDAVLVGACFGGWVAAEIMVRSTARFSRLVLVDPLGVKVSGRDERDIADAHGGPRLESFFLQWRDGIGQAARRWHHRRCI